MSIIFPPLEPCMGVHACAAHHQGLLYHKAKDDACLTGPFGYHLHMLHAGECVSFLLVSDTCLCAWPECEWQRVGTLVVVLLRVWLLFKSRAAAYHLDLFVYCPVELPQGWGRVCVADVELMMWPSWIRAYGNPALTDSFGFSRGEYLLAST